MAMKLLHTVWSKTTATQFLSSILGSWFIEDGITCTVELVDLGLLIVEVSRPHSNIAHSVGLLRASDRPVAETSTWQHTTLTRDRHPCTSWDSSPRSAADARLTPRGHWGRLLNSLGRRNQRDDNDKWNVILKTGFEREVVTYVGDSSLSLKEVTCLQHKPLWLLLSSVTVSRPSFC
jgi:hypothetical protein